MMLIVALSGGKWCVVNLETRAEVSGPYATHEDAVQAAETIAWRIAQGWAP